MARLRGLCVLHKAPMQIALCASGEEKYWEESDPAWGRRKVGKCLSLKYICGFTFWAIQTLHYFAPKIAPLTPLSLRKASWGRKWLVHDDTEKLRKQEIKYTCMESELFIQPFLQISAKPKCCRHGVTEGETIRRTDDSQETKENTLLSSF